MKRKRHFEYSQATQDAQARMDVAKILVVLPLFPALALMYFFEPRLGNPEDVPVVFLTVAFMLTSLWFCGVVIVRLFQWLPLMWADHRAAKAAQSSQGRHP